MRQRAMMKTKSFVNDVWIIRTFVKLGIKIFEC